MLDDLSILVSCGACALVAWRAFKLDRTLPWFVHVREARERLWQSRTAQRKA